MNRPSSAALVFGLLLPCAAGAQSFLADSAAGVKALQTWYVEDTGLWQTTGWWNAANATTVLVDYSKLSGAADYLPAIANTFDRNSAKGFLNQYYDDEGWWALAWTGAYELTHDARYLDMAERIFNDMASGWDNTCGGGIWWNKDKRYKNAIANELFLSVAANLGNLTKDAGARAAYLGWAEQEWEWFAASGMINADGLVNDGLDAQCHNNNRTTWSYNQGVILGGLSALAKLSGDAKPIDAGQSIAYAAMWRLSDQAGILHDPCEPARCGADGVQFKGIFARNLPVLGKVRITGLSVSPTIQVLPAPSPPQRFRDFLRANAEAIWKNRDAENRFGVVWSAPGGVTNAATQVSALDALLAAAEAEGAH